MEDQVNGGDLRQWVISDGRDWIADLLNRKMSRSCPQSLGFGQGKSSLSKYGESSI
jgi:hypothetical protein